MDREALIAAMQATVSRKPLSVEVEGWGTVYVKELTVEEVDAASDQKEPDDGKKRVLARSAARVICDANGERIFDAMNAADVDLLAKQPWSLLGKVLNAAEAKGVDSGN